MQAFPPHQGNALPRRVVQHKLGLKRMLWKPENLPNINVKEKAASADLVQGFRTEVGLMD